jgi:hypothetical protein
VREEKALLFRWSDRLTVRYGEDSIATGAFGGRIAMRWKKEEAVFEVSRFGALWCKAKRISVDRLYEFGRRRSQKVE